MGIVESIQAFGHRKTHDSYITYNTYIYITPCELSESVGVSIL